MEYGYHYLAKLVFCDPEKLDDEEYLKTTLESAANMVGATVLHTASHKFDPQGVTAFCMLSESHISIHTWPEKATCTLDVYTCGDADPQAAGEFIQLAVDGSIAMTQTVVR
jgi:S-adenosylmethionine decarboxylase proenzyme